MAMDDVAQLREQGNCEFRGGDFLKAAATYTRAIKADPACAVLYSNRSLALLKLNKLTKALSDAEHCTKLDPNNVKGWFRQAQVLEAQGHLEQAIDVLRKGADATASSGDQQLSRQAEALSRKLRDQGRPAAGGRSSSSAAGGGGKGASGVSENGGKAPASPAEAQALAFADAWIAYAQERLQEHGTDFEPTVHFLPGGGDNTPDHPHPQASVQGAKAFYDPVSLADFVNFVRAKGDEVGARAAVSVIPKSKVAFPQMWEHNLWPYSREQDGVFVQLEALVPASCTSVDPPPTAGAAGKAAGGKKRQKDARGKVPQGAAGDVAAAGEGASQAAGGGKVIRLWFVRLGARDTDGAFKVRPPHELPHALALLPSLMR